MSLQNLLLITRKEKATSERQIQKNIEIYKYKKEIDQINLELQSKIDSLNREYSTKIEIVEKARIRKIYEFYRKEILDFDYVGNRYIEEIGKYIIELALEYDDNDFLCFYFKRYSADLLCIEDNLKKYIVKLLDKKFIRKVIDKAESLVPSDTFYMIIDSLTSICTDVFPGIYIISETLPHLVFYKVNHAIKCHDINSLTCFLNTLSSFNLFNLVNIFSLLPKGSVKQL